MLDTILSVADSLGIDVFQLVMLVIFTIAFGAGTFLMNAWRKTAAHERYSGTLSLLIDVLWAGISAAEGDGIDLTTYELNVEQRAQEGLSYIDPRMLYVIDQGERWMAHQGYTIDADELLVRAEGLFNQLKGLMPGLAVTDEDNTE